MPVADEMQTSKMFFPDFTPLQKAVGLKVVPTPAVKERRRCCLDDDNVGALEMRKKLSARLFVASLHLSKAEHCCEDRVSN